MWRTAATFDPGRGSVVAWVTTIVRTRALDLIRAQRRRARVLDDAVVWRRRTRCRPPSEVTRPTATSNALKTRELVRRSLADLPDAQRACSSWLLWRHVQSEIAEFLSEPLGTIKTRMRGGLEKCASHYAYHGIGGPP